MATSDITAVISSHLHFDHCGQNDRFPNAAIIVQHAEVEAAKAAHYTVADWAFPPGVELTMIDGDVEVAPRVHVIATPGDTCGHQSVLVDDSEAGRTIVCCQASWSVVNFVDAVLGDDGWDQDVGAASLRRLHALRPDRVLLSHDEAEWRPHETRRYTGAASGASQVSGDPGRDGRDLPDGVLGYGRRRNRRAQDRLHGGRRWLSRGVRLVVEQDRRIGARCEGVRE